MGDTTGIAWCDHTFNPWVGCSSVSTAANGGGGCDHCYARALVKNRMGKDFETRWRTAPANWKKPLKWDRDAQAAGKRRRVFCASLADVFDNEVPDEWRHDLWELIHATRFLDWLILTKRIGNSLKMLPPLLHEKHGNVWIGASVVNQREADRDLPKLLLAPASVRFVSYEPAIGPVQFRTRLANGDEIDYLKGMVYPNAPISHEPPYPTGSRIDWVIVGGESAQGGARARPFDLSWAASTIDQCRAAGARPFVKQLGSNPFFGMAPIIRGKDRAGADPADWPEELRVQEFPR